MTLLEQLQKRESARILGIAECSPKQILLERLVREFKKKKQPLVLAHVGFKKMPPSGTIVIGKSIPIVCQEVQEALESPEPIILGKRIAHSRLEGFSYSELKKITRTLGDVPFFIELNCPETDHFLPEKEVNQWAKKNLWDQLVISMPVTTFLERLAPGDNRFSPDTFFNNSGVAPLFNQKWPTVLVLTGTDDTRLENQTMLLVREIKQQYPPFTVGLYHPGNNVIHWIE